MILTKLESHHLDLPIWRYKIHKTTFKYANLNYPTTKRSLTRGTRVSADPTGQRKETGDGACDGTAALKLADGGFSGDTEGTGVLPTTMRTYLCPHLNLYRAQTLTATCMADNGGIR